MSENTKDNSVTEIFEEFRRKIKRNKEHGPNPSTFNLVNTFEDSVETEGVEVVFNVFNNNSVNRGSVDLKSSLYKHQFEPGLLQLTLWSNAPAMTLLLPAKRYDRYYYSFVDKRVVSARLIDKYQLNESAKVTVLQPGYEITAANPENKMFSNILANGGILVEVGPGTDLTELLRKIIVLLELE